MIGRGRGGAPLLAGLAAGAVLVASVVLVGSEGAVPLTELSPEPLAALAPVTTPVPAPRPVPTLLPRLPNPLDLLTPPTTTPPPTTTEPPPTTTPPPEPEPEPDLGATDAVIAATNAERVDAGCDPLGFDPRLAAAAQAHSEDMAENGYLSHTGLDGSTPEERIRDAGYPDPGGENIARGQETAAEVVADWMASPGHRRNILDCGYVDIGVGFDPRGNFWAQEFGE